jgi:ATP-dependent helicase/DNAse subunit B
MNRLLIFTSHPFQAAQNYLGAGQVITPNPRAARALNTPFVSISTLASTVLEEAGIKVASETWCYRTLETLVRDVFDTSDPGGLCRVVAPLVRELTRIGISPDELKRSQAQQTQHLAELLKRYHHALQEAQLVDRSQVIWRALPLITKTQRLLVTGYPRLGSADLHFLDAIADTGSHLILPTAEHNMFSRNNEAKTHLAHHGWTMIVDPSPGTTLGEEISERLYTSVSRESHVVAEVFDSIGSEVRAALARVQHLLSDGVPAEDIVLVARNLHTYAPIVHAVAREYHVPVRLTHDLPAASTRIGSWLGLMADAILEAFSFETTVALVAHPFTNALSEWVWGSVRQKYPGNYREWLMCGVSLAAFNWPKEAPRHVYRQKFLEVLAKYNLEQILTSQQEEFETLTQVIAAVATSDDEIPLKEFLHDLKIVLSQLRVSSDLSESGVELHTPLALYGSRYAHVFILGLAEGIFPSPLQDTPFLDFAERKKLACLGVPVETVSDMVAREYLSFWATLQTATRHLYLSYPLQVGQTAYTASPFFAAMNIPVAQSEANAPVSLEEKRRQHLRDTTFVLDDVLERARQAWQAEHHRESHEPANEFDGIVRLPLNPQDFILSATQLTHFGQCSFRWFAAQVLGLDENQDVAEDLTPTLRGKLYHRVLEVLLSQVKENASPLQAARANLPGAFSKAEGNLNLSRLPNWEFRRHEHLLKLEQLLLSEDFLPQGRTIVATEQQFTMWWHDLQVKGTIDRIDKSDSGLVIVDYKTSSARPKGAKDPTGKTTLDVQLPIYLEAASRLYPGETIAEGLYYSLTSRDNRVLAKASPDDAGLELLSQRFKRQLAEGSFPVEPDKDGSACEHCPFDTVCRKGARLERKRVVPRADT